jgi:hypothetical protein
VNDPEVRVSTPPAQVIVEFVKLRVTFEPPCSTASQAAPLRLDSAALASIACDAPWYDEAMAIENPTSIDEARKTSEYSRSSTMSARLPSAI